MAPYSFKEESEDRHTRQREMGFIDYIPPIFHTSSNSHAAPGARRYIVVFDLYEGGSANFLYLEYDGNEEALARLDWIAAHNNDDEYQVKLLNMNSPIPESVVDDLMVLEDEELWSVLTANVDAPLSQGWSQAEELLGPDIVHFRFDGQIAMLPPNPPIPFPPEWENYACQLFTSHIRKYTRDWQE